MLGEINHFTGQESERRAMSISIPFNFDENLIKHAAAEMASRDGHYNSRPVTAYFLGPRG